MAAHLALFVALALGAATGCAKAPVVDRAMALARTGKEDQALVVLAAHLGKEPDDLAARRLFVRVLAITGDLKEARANVEELRKRLPPDDPTPFLELGHALELAHRFDEALEAYDDAARAAPSSPLGPRTAGLRAARWGESAVAEERLAEAVRRGATDAETFHALGLVRLHRRDLAGAEVAYRSALRADANAVDSLIGLASVALVREDFGAALAAYDAVRAKRPWLAAAELGRAYALLRLSRKLEAKDAIDRAESLGGPPRNVTKLRELLGAP